jgi:hypothetical protein
LAQTPGLAPARNIRLIFAYNIDMGEMKRQIAWENEQSARYASTVAICASTPKVIAAVADSVGLARLISKRVVGRQ